MPAPYRQPPTFGSGAAAAKTSRQSKTAILVPAAYAPPAVLCDGTFAGQTAQDAQRCRQPRYGIETLPGASGNGPHVR
jgi:hypothetical protein